MRSKGVVVNGLVLVMVLVMALVQVMVLAGSAGAGVGSQKEGGSLHKTYMGSASVSHSVNEECDGIFTDCPFYMPKGFLVDDCDSQGAGVGGVVFCGLPEGTQVRITVEDLVDRDPVAIVSCQQSGLGGEQLIPVEVWWYAIETADPVFTGQVPYCMDEVLHVFPLAGEATAGSVTLEVL